jgi:hypothetical protein
VEEIVASPTKMISNEKEYTGTKVALGDSGMPDPESSRVITEKNQPEEIVEET